MNLMYQSTRNQDNKVTASQAVLQGLSPDGGLYVPETIPVLTKTMAELSSMNYREVAYEVMKHFLTDYTQEELKDCIEKAYDSKFDTPEIAPLKKVGEAYYLELFHGATIAFKDMALSILPHLLTKAAKKNNVKEEIVILTATSGDTGKAALAGFADVEGTKIIVFYPKDGVSSVQEKQMVTQKGDNTSVIGIKGNFDDAQTGVKNIFNNKELAERMKKAGYRFSSANSINIGRLVPQIVYYVYSYADLYRKKQVEQGEKINVVVPTGNFGNILAAYYAKHMGVPINKLICASNENKVLFDFFATGIYDKNREFILTTSPSMDILVSSNLERLIYHIADGDVKKTEELMHSLSTKGSYEITEGMKKNLEGFIGGWASTEETKTSIKKVYSEHGYVLDTHTAVAASVYDNYVKQTEDRTKTVIVSTASPYKFAENVLEAVGVKPIPKEDYDQAKALNQVSGVEIPGAVNDLFEAPVLHNSVCESGKMQEMVENNLKII
ncbi:threonine synthase [Mobilitalea sibirica]|uniref:Threonine synthase n=1 Tax=Mobilitalea sibirica TaxID=1462919 RepID=A0A8J7KZJ6_9FIRM|nr:threonine synthase [Mobilitalea sibirica]MBH1940338.1 threonine synthase [Mobilitalea sibirica]